MGYRIGWWANKAGSSGFGARTHRIHTPNPTVAITTRANTMTVAGSGTSRTIRPMLPQKAATPATASSGRTRTAER